jgi:crotonobetainyl-CoA:carnitine CoA-transferase CaiB-like acyl-CoA transferase
VLPNFQIADLLGGALSAVTQILAALWQVARGGEGRFVDVSMAHASYAHNVVAQVALANDDAAALQPGGGLLNGGVPCYNLYRTQDGRWLAVGALELKFWQTLCHALGRDDWAERHWSLGQAIGGADAAALTRELAAIIESESLQTWIDRLEAIDTCVSPVLTPGEASRHPLFNAEVLQAMMDEMAARQTQQATPGMQSAPFQPGGQQQGTHAAQPARPIQPAQPGQGADTPGAPGGKKPFTYGPWG